MYHKINSAKIMKKIISWILVLIFFCCIQSRSQDFFFILIVPPINLERFILFIKNKHSFKNFLKCVSFSRNSRLRISMNIHSYQRINWQFAYFASFRSYPLNIYIYRMFNKLIYIIFQTFNDNLIKKYFKQKLISFE